MKQFSIRIAKSEEQRELTRLCVRATRALGYDEAFIDRTMPSLTITVPMITSGAVRVAQDASGNVVGVAAVAPTMVQGIALLHSIFVEPRSWRQGIGRMLFAAAAARARQLNAGAIMIYAEPSAEGFYRRLGATRIGEGPYLLSPEIVLPHFFYIVPHIVPRPRPLPSPPTLHSAHLLSCGHQNP